jgi:hypothetical protein
MPLPELDGLPPHSVATHLLERGRLGVRSPLDFGAGARRPPKPVEPV